MTDSTNEHEPVEPDPVDEPPVLTLRTIVCTTEDCPNADIPIELECAGTVICGVCSQPIEGDD